MDEATKDLHTVYEPVQHHWFFQEKNDAPWVSFSLIDSKSLEDAFSKSNNSTSDVIIPVESTRYDVNLHKRIRTPVYWKGEPSTVKRCSWFYKSSSGDMVPYDETVSIKLEYEYKLTFENGVWPRNVEMENGEILTFYEPNVLMIYPAGTRLDWGDNSQNKSKPRIIKRGVKDFDIDEGETLIADHILFMIHGIGSVCDLKLRTIEEAVNDFRACAYQLVQSHYKSSCRKGTVRRVEILPINWHVKLHSEETGIDQQLKGITLQSIPKLRQFTNWTLLDILFYTSPMYCEHVVSTVGSELNRIYELYKRRNANFKGDVSLGGHSLGSLIVFDLLSHQQQSEPEEASSGIGDESNGKEKSENVPKRKISRQVSYIAGRGGTGQPEIKYPKLGFEPKTFFALGSPIGMFVIIRGIDNLGENFSLPTCQSFFNIFHPYDPIAYRIEPLIIPEAGKLKPVLVPHHKGRKRMHIELKETMVRVGADIKQKFFESMKTTWNAFFQLANMKNPEENNEEEPSTSTSPPPQLTNFGHLNKGRRFDYVLQEAPYELFNDYIFALHSHVCYWDSEDTVLFMIKEIYSAMGVMADSQIPQQTMTVERVSDSRVEKFDELEPINDVQEVDSDIFF